MDTRQVKVSTDADLRRAFEEFYIRTYAAFYTNMDVTPADAQRAVSKDSTGQYVMPDTERCWRSWIAGVYHFLGGLL